MDAGMALFPDGGFVRLRSRARGTYVYAEQDTRAVSLRPLGAAPSINAVWKVQHWFIEGHATPFMVLQGAAYGRYLAVTNQRLPPLQRGFLVVQRDYDTRNLHPQFVWRPYSLEDGQDYVHLTNWGRCLRANGAPYHQLPITYLVTVHRKLTRMTEWRVETIPLSPVPLPLPPPPPLRLLNIMDVIERRHGPVIGRMIRFARVNDDGNIDNIDQAGEFFFAGRSVFNLRKELRLRQNDWRSIRLCVRGGMYGLPIPLLTDLPFSQYPMDIIVIATGSPADVGLTYPQFDVPEP